MILISPCFDFAIFLLDPIFYAVLLFLLAPARRKETFSLPGVSITLFPFRRHLARILFLRKRALEKDMTFRNLSSQYLLFHIENIGGIKPHKTGGLGKLLKFT
jgi:hypothetical protein